MRIWWLISQHNSAWKLHQLVQQHHCRNSILIYVFHSHPLHESEDEELAVSALKSLKGPAPWRITKKLSNPSAPVMVICEYNLVSIGTEKCWEPSTFPCICQ
ncbi:hypothetical protein MTR_1g047020 [Medicago truncatula]|uniref:Uncharacterized protein n=1 Tax=Medicago truncatula TaxID=3880 RepID=A0A072VHZ7_MEDTR|nr:hypothetical protein MTR_1g047020 [Medicago truncatula]